MKNSYIEIIQRLDKFVTSFSSISTIVEMVSAVEKILEETFNVDYTGLYLYDASEKRLKLLFAKGFDQEEFLEADHTAAERHPGLVFRTGKMIYIPDALLDGEQHTKSSKRTFVVRSRLYLPVMNGSQIVGAFGIVNSKPNAYDQDDIATLSFICNMAGALYGNLMNQSELKKMALIAKETENSAVITNPSGEIEWVNKAFTLITGYSPEEVLGKRPGDLLQGEDTDPASVALLSKAIREENPIEIDIVNYSKSKRKYWLKLQIQPVFDASGQLENFISIQKEITKEKEIEQHLVKSEARHARMVANISDVIAIIDQDGISRYKSPNIEKLFGWKPNEVVGISAFENVYSEDQDHMLKQFKTLLINPNVSMVMEFRYRCKNSSYKWIELTGINLLHDPDICGILANYHDITERKQADELIKESEAKFNNVFNRSPALIFLLTVPERRISAVNDTFIQKMGLPREEVIGKVIYEIPQLSISDINPEAARELQKSQRIAGMQLELKNKQGNSLHMVLSREIIETYGKQYFLVLMTDITDRIAAEEDLNKLSRAVEQSPVMTYITDLNGAIEYVNPKVLEITGYQKEELVGQNPKILSSGENQKKNYISLWQTISSGKEWKGEFHNKKKNGEMYWVSASLSPVFNISGHITHYIAVEEDITKQKEDYEALQIAHLRFQSLISSMQAGVMVEDENRKVVLVNQYFCDLFSIPASPGHLIGMECAQAAEDSKILFEKPESFIHDINNTLLLRQVIVNHELQMKSGTSLERDFIPIGDSDYENQGILWIYRNISGRKKAERDLLRQSKILGGTAMAMNYLLTIPDHQQAMQKALEAVSIATGVDRAYIFEAKIDEPTGETFLDQQFEWTGEGVIPEIGNSELQNMPFSREYPRWFNLLSNGQTLSGLVKDFPENERNFLEPQDIISLIVVPVFVNDVFWGTVGFDDCSKGIQWSSNEASILTALAASIGGSISRERIGKELSNARLIAEKATRTKSDFLATMSHEIRTPLNGVIGMTSLLLQTQLSPDQRDYTETIKISGELLLNLINDILDFSKIESGKMVLEEHPFDLRLAIEDVLDLMAASATKKKLGLYFQVDPAIPQRIMGDLTRLRQILVNLTGNAIKFTMSGEVTIIVKQIKYHDNDAILEFSVKDTGLGIAAEKIDHLFKPFSQVDASTTRKYGGTGLGLAICYKLVILMEGTIWVKSELNHGSEFMFTIKTNYQFSQEYLQDAKFSAEILLGKKSLILDSHTTSRTILSSLLKHYGMNILVADTAKSALSILSDHQDIGAVIIDNELDDMDCHELAAKIKRTKKFAHLPLVLIDFPTANGDESTVINYFHSRINKPLKQSQLLFLLANILSDNKKNQIQIKSVSVPLPLQKMNDLYPLNILVAEDNTINQKLILRLFEMLGYTINIAANGFEVIETLKSLKIDIVFMDIQMPEMDGFEATRQIISIWGERRPLIVAMTANALSTDKEKCLLAGMDDYISKPLTIDQVSKGIEKWGPLCRISEQSKS